MKLTRLRRAGIGVAALGLLLPMTRQVSGSSSSSCRPQPPGGYPSNPGYSPAENGQPGQTWDGEQWYLYSCIPKGTPLASDPEGAAGMSVDRVWNQLGDRGDDNVIVAYMEGGVNWRISESCQLKDRAWLNRGELPLPEFADGTTRVDRHLAGDPYDLNGDGVFNVEDYVQDPRIPLVEAGLARTPGDPKKPFLHQLCAGVGPGHSNITPEDLIVAFGHCQIDGSTRVVSGAFPCDPTKHYDNDGNGYANDINGWNFNRDDNDPQTEQSVYGHFDGESAQAVGEATNAGSAGLCPLCRYVPIKAGDEAIDRPDRVAEAIVYAADLGVKVMDVTSASLGLTKTVRDAIDYAYHKGMVITWASNDFESADHTDGMFYPHVWPGNSLTGDHSTRDGATCNIPPAGAGGALCPWVVANTTFRSRSSLTSYGPHALFSVPNNDGSTSTGTPTQAGVAALVMSEAERTHLNPGLNADEVKQVVRSTASYIGTLPTCPNCFQGVDGATFNIQYGYGRPNVYDAAVAVDRGLIPPTADIRSPDWYEEIDPTTRNALNVSADVAAPRAQSYTWRLQYGLGPQPLNNEWRTFASGRGDTPQNVSGLLDLTQVPASFWAGSYQVDPASRLSIERYDVTVRIQVFAGGDTATKWKMGEDRRAFHLRHDSTERPGFPIRIGSSGEASPAMADIEGRGWLDTIVATADGTLHAFRPDGTEAPGFPVHTGPAHGVDPTSDVNYLNGPGWRSGLVARPRDGFFSSPAVGDLRHDGGLEIVASTAAGRTYAWDGAGRLLPGFPVLDGSPANWHMSVPPPDTPYSFEPQNVAGGAPVLADLTVDGHLDIIQVAGDNHVYAWHVDERAVQPVPGWPVCIVFDPLPKAGQPCVERPPPAGQTHTHDGKIVPTPAVADVDGDGRPDVIVGLDDSTWDNTSPLGSDKITAYLEAFDGTGTRRSPTGELPGWPVAIPGLIQGYGVAQDFVTQGVESPAVYDSPRGPQAVVNANLFAPFRVDLKSATTAPAPFVPAVVPVGTPRDCAPPLGPNVSGVCGLVQFTTSPSLGNVLGLSSPQVFQSGSAGVEVALGITQIPGFGIRVENGLGAWDPTTGLSLPPYEHYAQGLAFFSAPAIADVSGDGTPDIIEPGDSGALSGIDGKTGLDAAGFPKWTGGWTMWTPAIGDLTGSGTVAVAAVTREGYLHVWNTPGLTSANRQAWHWHQDDRNTGHYGTDTRPPSGIADLVVTQQGGDDLLRFTAVGDDWKDGTADHYLVRRAPFPITQDDWASATPVTASTKPGVSGTVETLTVPHADGMNYYAVRAVDAAGNIGPIVY